MNTLLKERLEKIRIRLIRHKPFFGYIIPKLTFISDPKCSTAGIDAYGHLYYSEKFLTRYSDDTVEGIICHELLHYVLKHHTRGKDFKSHKIANIAQDLLINDIIIHLEKMKFIPCIDTFDYSNNSKPKAPKGFCTSKDGIFTIIDTEGNDIKIQVRGNSWEYVYDCLMSIQDKQNSSNRQTKSTQYDGSSDMEEDIERPEEFEEIESEYSHKGNGSTTSDKESNNTLDQNNKSKNLNAKQDIENQQSRGEQKEQDDISLGDSFDQHIWADLTKEEREKIEQQINDIFAEAKTFTDKTQGRNPDSDSWMTRILNENLKPQVDWKTYLRRSIQPRIPYDFTYSKPNKRSYSAGYYIPNILKDSFEVTIAVDVSGSISDKEFSMFMTEFKSIIQSKPNVKVRTLFWSTEVDKENDKVYKRSDIANLSDNLPPIHTTGGTSMSCVNNYLTNLKYDKNKSTLDTIIYLTDGYIEPNPILYSKTKNNIFVITSCGYDKIINELHKGPVIRLSDRC